MTLDLQKVEDLEVAAGQVRRSVGACYTAKLKSLGSDQAALAWESSAEGQRFKRSSARALQISGTIQQKLSAFRDSGALSRWWYRAENASWLNRMARELAEAARQVDALRGCTVRVRTPKFGSVGLADWLTGGTTNRLIIAAAVAVVVLILVKT